jgi:hypothetical protein
MQFDLNHTGTMADNITFSPIITTEIVNSQVKIGAKEGRGHGSSGDFPVATSAKD